MKRIKVGGNYYRIKPDEEDNLGDAAGDTDRCKHLIRLDKTLSGDPYRHILLHEILHALNFEWSEKEVEALATALEQILVDNPEFTKLFL